jgi:hypothetical protein
MIRLANILIAVAAFWVVWHYGFHGIFMVDVGILFDAGWRVVQGQIPYRDFYMAYLPATAWLQGLAFSLTGVNFAGLIWPAALFNFFGALLTARIVSLFFPDRRWIGLVAATVSAIYFQGPMAFLQHEPAAYFFDLVALWLVLEHPQENTSRTRLLLDFAAGLSFAIAVLCKQNAGGIFLLPLAAALVLRRAPLRIGPMLSFVAGGAACVASLAAWLYLVSDPKQFWYHAIFIPARFGGGRLLAGGLFSLLRTLVFEHGGFNLITLAPAWTVLLWSAWNWRKAIPSPWRPALLAILLLVYQNLLLRTMLNEAESSRPFTGLVIGLVVGSFLSIKQRRLTWALCSAYLAIMSATVFYLGAKIVVTRDNQQFKSATFREHVQIPGAERLLWGEPTMMGKTPISREHFEQVAGALRRRNTNFFVFADSTILYGLLGKPSPQPFLYLWRNHSYRLSESKATAEQMVAALKKNNIQTIVLERDFDAATSLEELPALAEWIHQEFVPAESIGLYTILDRRAGQGSH